MSYQDHIAELEQQLQKAVKTAQPVIVETIKYDRDEIVTVSSHGTTRRDYLGGTLPDYSKKSTPVVEVPLTSRPFDKELGKLLENNDSQRTLKLKSGTLRVDLKG